MIAKLFKGDGPREFERFARTEEVLIVADPTGKPQAKEVGVSLSVECPSCRKSMRVPDEAAGRSIRCRHCHRPFVAKADGRTTISLNLPVIIGSLIFVIGIIAVILRLLRVF